MMVVWFWLEQGLQEPRFVIWVSVPQGSLMEQRLLEMFYRRKDLVSKYIWGN